MPLALLFGCGAPAQSVDLLIRNVYVYSGAGEHPALANVAIRDGKFLAIDKSRKQRFKATGTVDGNAMFMSPGLWDMHAHVADTESGGLDPLGFLQYGVTGIRDTGGHAERIDDLQKALADGRLPGPRIESVGPVLNGQAFASFHLALDTPEQAIAAVERLVRDRHRQIKIHRALTRDVYQSILRAAHASGASVVGHIPLEVSPLQACELGQDGIEHLGSFLESHIATMQDGARDISTAIAYLLSDEAVPLFDCLRTRRVFVTPTLVVYPAVAKSRGFEELPATLAEQIEGMQAVVLRLYESGVPLLVGTDTASIGPLNIEPGRSYHAELEMLQQAGIPPRAIVRMATANAAAALGLDATHGAIEPGKVADFLLTPRDPAEDIRHLAEFDAVYVNGEAVVAAAPPTAAGRGNQRPRSGPVQISPKSSTRPSAAR
ncbi:MAG: amidohydrolase family protein [Woeseiaceae bacterium]|nr:amidohydrolase family protein [Woeseiaceae bacterium]